MIDGIEIQIDGHWLEANQRDLNGEEYRDMHIGF